MITALVICWTSRHSHRHASMQKVSILWWASPKFCLTSAISCNMYTAYNRLDDMSAKTEWHIVFCRWQTTENQYTWFAAIARDSKNRGMSDKALGTLHQVTVTEQNKYRLLHSYFYFEHKLNSIFLAQSNTIKSNNSTLNLVNFIHCLSSIFRHMLL